MLYGTTPLLFYPVLSAAILGRLALDTDTKYLNHEHQAQNGVITIISEYLGLALFWRGIARTANSSRLYKSTTVS